MSQVSLVAEIKVDDVTFPSTVKPPASNKTLFLGGAGIRGLEKEGGKFVKVMGIGVYVEDSAVPCLAEKWKGKTPEELTNSAEFFTDVITGPFEKFTRVTMVLPISGQQYAERMSGSCTEYLKSAGTYSDAEAKAIEKFVEGFKEENFSPGASILFTQLANGSLAISFSQDESTPKVEKTVIENKLLSEALLESMIGKNGVSPATKKSLADRLSVILKQSNENGIGKHRSLVTEIKVEAITFSPTVKPPASKKTLFLAGAGVRGLEIEGKFVKFTGIGFYLEDTAMTSLAVKWKGKSADELNDSVEFFRDIVTGPFEKFARVTTILQLTGQEYSSRVAQKCTAHWKAVGIYTDAEAKAIEKFVEAFKDEIFPPGSSFLYTQFPNGSLAISFTKDGSIPEAEKIVIENKPLSEAALDLMIGKHGVSPALKQSLASRLSELMKGTSESGSIGN